MDSFLKSAAETLQSLSVDPKKGLSAKQAEDSRKIHGENAFTREKQISLARRIAQASCEPMVILLIMAALITLGVNVARALTGGEADYIECVGIFTAIMLAGAALVGGYGISMALLVGIIGAVGGWAVCGIWLSHAGKKRGEEIDRYLPPALELLTISVSAGVLVERGFRQLAENKTLGPLADEFARTDMEISHLGVSRVDALDHMRRRCDSPLMGYFCAALIEATRKGTSISGVLESQAKLARKARYDALTAQINKLSTKMAVPLVFFLIAVLVLACRAVAVALGAPVGVGATMQEQVDASVVFFAVTTVALFACFLVVVLCVGRLGRGHTRAPSWDALLVAGDVFDTSAPSNRAQELYYRFLCRVAASSCRHIVVVAGNHDSPSFLNAPKELLKALDVHVVGSKIGRAHV